MSSDYRLDLSSLLVTRRTKSDKPHDINGADVSDGLDEGGDELNEKNRTPQRAPTTTMSLATRLLPAHLSLVWQSLPQLYSTKCALRSIHTSSHCRKSKHDKDDDNEREPSGLLDQLRNNAATLVHQKGWDWERLSDIESRRAFVSQVEKESWNQPDGLQAFMNSRGITVGYVYSSGPGGQHVNKTQSRAQVLLALATTSLDVQGKSVLRDTVEANALPSEVLGRMAKVPRWLPPTVAKALVLRSGAHYSRASHSVTFEAQDSRSQHANLLLALGRMQEHVLQVARTGLPSPPSDQQLTKVHHMAQAHKRKTKENKKHRSDNKTSKRSARGAL